MNDNHYYAGNFPAGYHAPPNTNPLTIDFAQLSGTATDSDVIAKGDVVNVEMDDEVRPLLLRFLRILVPPVKESSIPALVLLKLSSIS